MAVVNTVRSRRAVSRGDVFLVALDPTRGTEIKKTRPCVVVSPNELNANLQTAIVAPMTTAGRPFPFRCLCTFQGKTGQVVLDQLRTVDRERLMRRLGRLDAPTVSEVLARLQEMFAE